MPNQDIDTIFAYHQATKHHFSRFADGPGQLDWATQPDPFRRYGGTPLAAPLIKLAHVRPGDEPPYPAGFQIGHVPPAPLDFAGVSRLFFDSLALSAWKQYGGERWALRVNPSSGNLHPTEGYLICGPVSGLIETPMVAHYAPREHALEVRATFPHDMWQALTSDLPPGAILAGLTSIHWREAWKYGQRAYRYCQHDVGHALAAISIAAAGLGWQAHLLDGLSTDQVAVLLGVADQAGPETEHGDCIVAILPHGTDLAGFQNLPDLSPEIAESFRHLARQGRPNRLSARHVAWEWIGAAAVATRKPVTQVAVNHASSLTFHVSRLTFDSSDQQLSSHARSLRRIIHQRRSAQQMDGHTAMARESLYAILARTMPGQGRAPFAALPWEPHVHLALFVHRVTGLDPGLYLLARDPAQTDALRAALKPEFAWETPAACPPGLPFYRLQTGDATSAARRISCGQEIAADGCFSLGMIAEFARPLAEQGAWMYPRLFWECGMIGQVLYLEAEAAGLRGTGIGCFFDDAMHALLGLNDTRYQSLYHFTVGGPEEDRRLTTLPAYDGVAG
ncbi:MAG: SagB/ThcOx family dehydrogenase [Anaerolineae bacterium]|nr:SagB/ThcOx family dehydrogenase [Anaerolineae bacterium]